MPKTDPISLAALRAAIAGLLAKNFAHWQRMDPQTWAETVRKMPDDHGGVRGFTFDYAPYQREMFDAAFDPRNQKVVFRLASRLGKSEVFLNAIGYRITQHPAKILVMWPKNDDAEEWSKKNLMRELVEPTPECSELIIDGRGRRMASNTIKMKMFPGGYISMFGANVPGDFRRAKGNVLYAEEIDAIAESESDKDEGDQLGQFAIRGSEYPDTVFWEASYPSLVGKSRITADLEDSDYRRWYVPCLRCGFDEWEMHRRDLRYDPAKPEEARLECPHCHDLFTDAQRYEMSRLPERWTPTRPFTGKAGFHANALLWPHPVSPEKYPGGFLQMLAQEEIDAANSDNPERARRVIVNTRDAEPFQPEHIEKVEHTNLYLCREEGYDPREVLPDEVLLVTFGADLQGDRAEIKFKGFGLSKQSEKPTVDLSGGVERHAGVAPYGATVPPQVAGFASATGSNSGESPDGHSGSSVPPAQNLIVQSWAIDYRIVRGSAIGTELWERLENLFRNIAWKRSDGTTIQIACGLFDAGFKPDYVYTFCRRMRGLGLRIYPCVGAVTLGRPIVGKPIKRGALPIDVYEVGTHEAKDVIYQRLEFTDPTRPGYMHFPAVAPFSEIYFQQLTSEESQMTRGKDGKFYRHFWLPETSKQNAGSRNEALDCEVYADAAERVLRPNYAALAEKLAITPTNGQQPKPEPRPQPARRVLPQRSLAPGWRR